MASVWGPSGVTFFVVFGKRDHLFAYSVAGPFWRGAGLCFGLQNMILGCVLGSFWGGVGPGKSCHSVQLSICIFRVWALLERSLFPDPLLEGIWHAFGQIWVPIGTPIESLWASVSASGGYHCGM